MVDRSSFVGASFLLGTILSWQVMGMIGTGVTESYPHFYFFVWCLHDSYILAGVPWCLINLFVRNKAFGAVIWELCDKKLNILCAVSSVLSLFASLFWYYSLPITILSANNAIYQTTPLFVFILSVLFLGQKVTRVKVMGLIICGFGVFFISYFTHNQVDPDGYIQKSEVQGYILVCLSALTLAVFEVVYDYFSHSEAHTPSSSRKGYRHVDELEADHLEDLSNHLKHGLTSSKKKSSVDIEFKKTDSQDDKALLQVLYTMKFLCLVGTYNLLLLFPGVYLISAMGLELDFVPPTEDITQKIVVVALLELVYNACLFSGIAVSSSVFMAVGQILIIPLGYAAEFVLDHKQLSDHSPENYLGVLFIIIGFLLLQDLSCYKDVDDETLEIDDENSVSD